MGKVYILNDRVKATMNKTTIYNVANYFLLRADSESGSIITHLKLQKLCYYANSWHLAFEGDTLFDQCFQAWAHGPVCPELWHKYKNYGFNPISAPEVVDDNNFTEEQMETLEEVWRVYGDYDAKYLEKLTHQEEPWIEARGTCMSGEICSNIISTATMKRFYGSLLENE